MAGSVAFGHGMTANCIGPHFLKDQEVSFSLVQKYMRILLLADHHSAGTATWHATPNVVRVPLKNQIPIP